LLIFQSSLKIPAGQLPEALELTAQKPAPGTHTKLFRSDSQSHGKRGCMKMEAECEKRDRWAKWVIKVIVGGSEIEERSSSNES